MTLIISREVDDVEEVVAHFVPLSAAHERSRTCHKVVCSDCGHHVCPESATLKVDGYLCEGCLDS